MFVLAAIIDWAHALPIIIGLLGIAGIIFTALKYNRDDTTAVVTQQSMIVGEMKTLNDELREPPAGVGRNATAQGAGHENSPIK